jgi:CheY-like chemotaxis protein
MPYKLLLADDSVTIQRVIELTFADEDVQVIAVGDGKQAIHRAQQDPPDIILADVGMPERDGYEVTTFIKQTPELKHIPVLLLTGAFEPIDEGRARAAGCDGVLVKPFEPQLVINRVRELLRARSATPSVPAVAPPPPVAPPTGSIEEYFDRLDAAFSSLDTSAVLGPTPGASEPPPARAASVSTGDDALAGWKPDIPTDPSSMMTLPPPPPIDLGWPPSPSAPASQGFTPSADPGPSGSVSQAASAIAFKAPAVPPPAPPSLAEAFAALLAAEQGRPFAPAAQPQVQVDDRTIEEVTRRVLDRMSDRVVKDTVVDTAERLVREEIDRIKSNAR